MHHLIGWTQFLFLIYTQTPVAKNDPFGKEKKLNIQSSPSPLPKFPSYNLIFHSIQFLKGQNLSIKPTFDSPTVYSLKKNSHNSLQALSFQIITLYSLKKNSHNSLKALSFQIITRFPFRCIEEFGTKCVQIWSGVYWELNSMKTFYIHNWSDEDLGSIAANVIPKVWSLDSRGWHWIECKWDPPHIGTNLKISLNGWNR